MILHTLRQVERHFEEALSCFGLAVVAVCVFLQVIMRYGFNSALQWSEEVAAIAMVWAVYMGAVLCVRERFHIRIMAGVMLLPTKAATGVVILADVIWLGFSVFMVKISIDYLEVLWTFTSTTPRLGINEFYPQSIVFIGYTLMIVRLLQLYAGWWRGGRRGIPGMRPEHNRETPET
ncbi:TRAP transporter small permease [Pelagibius sp.]|uniref:TRAP transporter small permease n=1 Tax=Pelagibius sp. TaxID=1931238 RepID=UPI003B512F63